ncbi:MAG: caspase family protein [Candidatus Melainabacteria bacterium]|nr:caspase family protein [Candidatus Melainabacteria bacterium]
MHGQILAVVLTLLLVLPPTAFCRGRRQMPLAKMHPPAVKSQASVAKVPAPAGKAQKPTVKVLTPKQESPTTAMPQLVDTPVADKWALIIGISKFKDPGISLKYPAKDARDLYNFLISEGNFAPDHVKLLLNEEASRGNILSALGDKWLPRVANPNDLVLIYISSHGSPSSLDVGGVNYLVAYDTDKESLFSTGIPMQDLVRMIKGRVHSDRIVMVLDACHSGAASPDGKAVFHQGNVNVEEIAQGTGQLVISSSAPDQVSWESQDKPNSVFTRYLIDGLRQNGTSTKLGAAYQYMKDKVQEEVLRDRGVLQTPVLRSKWEGSELVLAAPPTKPRPALKVPVVDEAVKPAANVSSGDRQPIVQAAVVAPTKEPVASQPTELTLWKTYMDTAKKLREEGRVVEAEKILGAAQREADNFPANDLRRISTVCELADLYVSQQRYSDAEPICWKVLPELEKASASHSVELSAILINLGEILAQKGKYGDAESMCKQALLLREKTHASEDESTAKCLDILAQGNFQANRYAPATELAQKALAIRERSASSDERALAKNIKLLAALNVAQERYSDAESFGKRALELSERVFGPNSLQVVESLDLYITVLSKLQRAPEARRLEYRAKAIRAKLGKPSSSRY